ncbi:MAG: GIY-YIG nuclease family protein [Candidatus Gottesmanbacteria bacterium]|nr:GIY-YIG nuclease family protein [Candidatus Gottesmanbacteria bacterium]
MKQFAIYILTNLYHSVLYTGVTNNLVRRVYEHRQLKIPGFTQKYKVTQLVYYEFCLDPKNAIKREKQIKNLVRRKKIAMIDTFNPEWKDLYQGIL